MHPKRSALASYIAVLIGAAAMFVLTTITHDRIAAEVLVSTSLLPAALVALVAGGSRLARRPRRTDLLTAVLGGAAAFWAAPALALSQRATDAPSGSESLFFIVVLWGTLVSLTGLLSGTNADRLLALVVAVAGTSGATAILACWERPSSFSPLVKYPRQELVMVVAGVLFAAGSWLLARSVRRIGAPWTLVASSSAAFLASLVTLVGTPAPLMREAIPVMGSLALIGAANALFINGWVRLSAPATPVVLPGSALMAVPVIVTGLTFVERASGTFGPAPFASGGVIAGAFVTLASVLVAWVTEPSAVRDGTTRRAHPLALPIVAVFVAAGVAALSLPAVRVTVRSFVGEWAGQQWRWTLQGFLSAGSWVLFAGTCALFAAIAVGRHARRRRSGLSALALVCALAAIPLAGVPLRTWNREWPPAEVQQVYGTEYATIDFEAIGTRWREAIAVSTALAALGLIALAVRDVSSRKDEQ